MADEHQAERRIDRLEAELAIRNLVSRYCFDIDDRDLPAVAGLFADNAVVRSLDGMMNATGVEAIIEQYRGRFAVLGVSNHMTHDHVVSFDAADPDVAFGKVSAHAELWRNGALMVTALRYADIYRRTGGAWRFQERVLSFLYYVPIEDYAGILGVPDRMRAYGAAQTADYPERLPSWSASRAAT